MFESKVLPAAVTATAPDGSDVRLLLEVRSGGLAHFELGPNETAVAVRHRTVDEVWYFVGGLGEMWRRSADREECVDVYPSICLTIPAETEFQFRSGSAEPLAAIGVTMPPWPGEGEAVIVEDGPWEPSVPPGPV